MKKRKIKIGSKENPFQKIPSDVICYEIFSYLDIKEVVNFGLLNKECYEYANENIAWKVLFNANTFKKRVKELDNIISFNDEENWKEKFIKYYKLSRDCTFKKSQILSSFTELQKIKKNFFNELQFELESILNISEEEFHTKINIAESIFKRKKLNHGFILQEKEDIYEIYLSSKKKYQV